MGFPSRQRQFVLLELACHSPRFMHGRNRRGAPRVTDPSGLNAGWNCLFLFPTVGGYTARMVPVEDPYTCTRPARPDTLTRGKALNVSFSSTGLGEGNYPAVGRWDWDGHTHYIGLGCHKRWCEVTDPFVSAFAPSDDYRLQPGGVR